MDSKPSTSAGGFFMQHAPTAGTAHRHCEHSEAIQCEGIPSAGFRLFPARQNLVSRHDYNICGNNGTVRIEKFTAKVEGQEKRCAKAGKVRSEEYKIYSLKS
jgi:hypothetical protein